MAQGETNNRTIGPVTSAATGGAALATILGWVLKSIFDMDVPPEVMAAFAATLPILGALIGGWLVKPGTGKRAK